MEGDDVVLTDWVAALGEFMGVAADQELRDAARLAGVPSEERSLALPRKRAGEGPPAPVTLGAAWAAAVDAPAAQKRWRTGRTLRRS